MLLCKVYFTRSRTIVDSIPAPPSLLFQPPTRSLIMQRIDKSGAEGDVMKEAQSINKSLSALGDVIAALTTGGNKHVPYRNHPLTMLMSDSIGGNAKTLMFVNTSPADYNVPETVSSLGFASRCKDITNSGVSSGPGAQAAQVQALKKELAKLKKSGPGKPGAALGSSGLVRPG